MPYNNKEAFPISCPALSHGAGSGADVGGAVPRLRSSRVRWRTFRASSTPRSRITGFRGP
eukprot:939692-Rhodomonas_salina.2